MIILVLLSIDKSCIVRTAANEVVQLVYGDDSLNPVSIEVNN